jgi:putative hemolysin
MAQAGCGFYSAREFKLDLLPQDVLRAGVELGRASLAREHRNPQALFMLWKGIAAYMRHSRKRYLFGCCSLTSQDPSEGLRVMRTLKSLGHVHPTLDAPAQSGFECDSDAVADDDFEASHIPRLFRVYLHYGAKVCSPPAIDRDFKTIDFLVVFDLESMDGMSRAFFGAWGR